MKEEIFALAVLASAWSFTFALAGCPRDSLPPEPPFVTYPPELDGGEDALCRVACENLARMGCPEPEAGTCREACVLGEQTNNSINPICVANASTPDQVRMCQTVRCRGR